MAITWCSECRDLLVFKPCSHLSLPPLQGFTVDVHWLCPLCPSFPAHCFPVSRVSSRSLSLHGQSDVALLLGFSLLLVSGWDPGTVAGFPSMGPGCLVCPWPHAIPVLPGKLPLSSSLSTVTQGISHFCFPWSAVHLPLWGVLEAHLP